ncbi:MAG TPA: fluoride efflux transporter CrcB [Ktedonobacteraceae bacterium]|nr:fluoride efflux transporter CrcB [Ktedonobacteraceae bacterium]
MPTTLSTRRRMLAVLSGGFLGTITRYLLSIAIQSWLGKNWPYDILIINVTGALALALVTMLADDTMLIGPTRRLFINVGFLGAYTTFSTLTLGDVLLASKQQWSLAVLYLVASIIGGVLAIWLGDWLGQLGLRTRRRFIQQAKVAARKRTHSLPALSPDSAANETHVDIQDDVLLPEPPHEAEMRREH